MQSTLTKKEERK